LLYAWHTGSSSTGSSPVPVIVPAEEVEVLETKAAVMTTIIIIIIVILSCTVVVVAVVVVVVELRRDLGRRDDRRCCCSFRVLLYDMVMVRFTVWSGLVWFGLVWSCRQKKKAFLLCTSTR